VIIDDFRIGSSGYDAAWSSLRWVQKDYGVTPDTMWITQLGHWDKALKAQEESDHGVVDTFGSFNTRMLCCKGYLAPSRNAR
jgi:FKBP12-rapamycin complex-associated protein